MNITTTLSITFMNQHNPKTHTFMNLHQAHDAPFLHEGAHFANRLPRIIKSGDALMTGGIILYSPFR